MSSSFSCVRIQGVSNQNLTKQASIVPGVLDCPQKAGENKGNQATVTEEITLIVSCTHLGTRGDKGEKRLSRRVAKHSLP